MARREGCACAECSYVPCPVLVCVGGKVGCPTCDPFNEPRDGTCPTCRGAGAVPCPTCKGTAIAHVNDAAAALLAEDEPKANWPLLWRPK